MAINFAEVFLRESGASQDRAQSMAEMQLRAKQFEQNYSLALARQKVAERAQTLAEEGQKFTQTRLENADTLSAEDRKYYLENIQPLELEEAQNKLQQTKYATELTKAQLDDVNAVMPDDLAEELGMQKGTKWSDAERILQGRDAIYQQKLRRLEESARAKLYQTRQALLEKPIEATEVGEFKTPDEDMGVLGGIGTRIGGLFDFLGTSFKSGAAQKGLEAVFGTGMAGINASGVPIGYSPDVKINPQDFDEALRRKKFRETQRDQDITKQGLERLLEKSRPDLLDPLEKDLYNAAITSGYFNTSTDALNTQATFDLLPQGVSFPSADISTYLESLLPPAFIEEE